MGLQSTTKVPNGTLQGIWEAAAKAAAKKTTEDGVVTKREAVALVDFYSSSPAPWTVKTESTFMLVDYYRGADSRLTAGAKKVFEKALGIG